MKRTRDGLECSQGPGSFRARDRVQTTPRTNSVSHTRVRRGMVERVARELVSQGITSISACAAVTCCLDQHCSALKMNRKGTLILFFVFSVRTEPRAKGTGHPFALGEFSEATLEQHTLLPRHTLARHQQSRLDKERTKRNRSVCFLGLVRVLTSNPT